MGYSNNKWRKILTILMIINLCFILFAKITKVFGAFSLITYKNINYSVSDNLNNYYLICLISYNNGYYHYDRIISDEPATIINTYNYGYRLKFVDNSKWSRSTANSQSIQINFFDSPNAVPGTKTSFQTDIGASNYTTDVEIWANYNVKNSSGDIVISETSDFIYPFFDNVTDIGNGYPDGVYISAGDYSNNNNLYFHLLQIDKGLSNSDTSVYYYSDKTFILNKDSKYYRTFDDPNIDVYYYFIPRYELSLSQNTSYLYVLNNSNNQIQNSYGIYERDVSNGIYDVVQSDTAGVITATEEESDRMKNIEQTLVDNQNSMGNIENTLTDSNVSQDTETNIDDNLTFNNSAPNFSNLYSSFFSRLSDTITSLSDYNLSEIETINLPIPFTQRTILLTSNMVSQNMPEFLTTLFTMFWLFIFGKYFLAYILFIYRLVASGHILENINSNNEVITNDVL